MAARRRDSLGDIDWLGMTKLTHALYPYRRGGGNFKSTL